MVTAQTSIHGLWLSEANSLPTRILCTYLNYNNFYEFFTRPRLPGYSFTNLILQDLLRRTLFKYDGNATNCGSAQPHESENRLKDEPEPK